MTPAQISLVQTSFEKIVAMIEAAYSPSEA